VIDLAVHYEAEYIVTSDAAHFPTRILAPHGIEAINPNRFAAVLCDRDMDAVFRAAEEHRCSMTRTLPEAGAYLESLRSYGKVGTAVDRLAAADFVTRARPCDTEAQR
jgi:hypothetical protein